MTDGGGGGQLVLRPHEQAQGLLKWRHGGRHELGSQPNPEHTFPEVFSHGQRIPEVEVAGGVDHGHAPVANVLALAV